MIKFPIIAICLLLISCASTINSNLVRDTEDISFFPLTPQIINNADGIEFSNFPPVMIENAWEDESHHEFIICISDKFNSSKIYGERYSLRLPMEIKDKENMGMTLIWPGGYDRYQLAATVFDPCIKAKENYKPLQVVKVPSDQNKILDKVNYELLNKKYGNFVVYFTRDYKDAHLTTNDWPCGYKVNQCLMVLYDQLTKQSEYKTQAVIIISQLVSISKEKPLWNIMVPFSLLYDIAVFSFSALLLIGSGGNL